MSVARGLGIVVACALGFGAAGGLLGLGLGVAAPAYYRGVFRAGDDPGFIPWQIGLGVGTTEGAVCGVVVGCVVVLAAALSGSRQKAKQDGLPADEIGTGRHGSKWPSAFSGR